MKKIDGWNVACEIIGWCFIAFTVIGLFSADWSSFNLAQFNIGQFYYLLGFLLFPTLFGVLGVIFIYAARKERKEFRAEKSQEEHSESNDDV